MTSATPVRPQAVPSPGVAEMHDVGDCPWKHSLTVAQTPAVESDGPMGNMPAGRCTGGMFTLGPDEGGWGQG